MKINAKEKRGRQNKKAVSEVLATILIVLFVIAALVIVSVVLFQFIRKQSGGITAGCVTIEILITKAEFNATSSMAIVYVKRAAGDEEMAGMKFIFDGKEKAPSEGSDSAKLNVLETGKYIFSNITSKPKKIEIAPVIKTDDDKGMNCGIKAIIREKDIVEKSISAISTASPSSSAPQSQDIRDGLVAEWRFDEQSGTTAADSSGSNNPGSLVNGPAWTAGKKGNALQFDGIDDYISFASETPLHFLTNGTLSEFTIVAWFKISDTSSPSYGNILFAKTNPGGYNDFDIAMDTGFGGKIRFHYGSSEGRDYWSNAVVNTGQWVYFALTRSNSGIFKMYINGNADKEFTDSASIPNHAQSAYIAKSGRPGAGENWNGGIDEVRLYSRTLLADEVSQLYQYYQ